MTLEEVIVEKNYVTFRPGQESVPKFSKVYFSLENSIKKKKKT